MLSIIYDSCYRLFVWSTIHEPILKCVIFLSGPRNRQALSRRAALGNTKSINTTVCAGRELLVVMRTHEVRISELLISFASNNSRRMKTRNRLCGNLKAAPSVVAEPW